MTSQRQNKIKQFNTKRYVGDRQIPRQDILRYKKLLERVNPRETVLDVGCASGNLMQLIKDKGAKVEGIEVSQSAINVAKKYGFKVYSIDLESEWSKKIEIKYDHVIAAEIIEHIYDTDDFLQQIRKVLKKGGKLSISTPNVASFGRRMMLFFGVSPHLETTLRLRDAGHVRYYTFKTLKDILIENGFKVIAQTSTYVNFDMKGDVRSRIFAELFSTLGATIITHAEKE